MLDADGSLERIESISCFAHGQLYVALSRVGDPRKVRVYLCGADYDSRTTEFVVFREALLANAVVHRIDLLPGEDVECLLANGTYALRYSQ